MDVSPGTYIVSIPEVNDISMRCLLYSSVVHGAYLAQALEESLFQRAESCALNKQPAACSLLSTDH